MARVCLILFGAITSLVTLAAQDPPPFRGGTELVPIYATVTDDEGRLVPDLNAADFEVRDNGRRQPLAFFSSEVQPFSAVVMLDRSGSMADNFDLIRDAASEFVRQMLPGDRVRIGNFSSDILMAPEDFTSDQRTLIGILENGLQEAGPSPVWTAIDRSVTALLPRKGRRVVLVFSDGHDAPARGQVRTALDDVRRRVRTDEIMVYAIGFAGTTVQQSILTVPRGPVLWPPRAGASPFKRTGGWSRKVQKPDRGLKELAEESGGGYFELDETDNLRATFARVAEELHRQYLLAIVPGRPDGKTHELDVKVKRRGVEVRARRSYVADIRQ